MIRFILDVLMFLTSCVLVVFMLVMEILHTVARTLCQSSNPRR